MEQNLFGQILLNYKLISQEQLDKCLQIQRSSESPPLLGEILIQQGLIDQKTLNTILSVQKRNLEITRTQRAPEAELRERLKGATLLEFLKAAREMGASDLYVTTGLKPLVRMHGSLVDLPAEPFGFEESRKFVLSVLTSEQVDRYYADKNLQCILSFPDAGRFRASYFRHYEGIGAVFRVIADKVWPLEKLDVPSVVQDFTRYARGLIIVTGPAGSGKTTTLCSLVNLINRNQKLHIITIEDPIEVVFKSEKSFVSQREIPTHSKTFASALRVALREDPDVIVVGEMRDPETVATAITAAETGHLIFGTLHTQNAYRTVLRVLDQYPSQKRAHIRTLLAEVLRAVLAQQLVPNIDGKSRSLACEVMVVDSAISNMIREDKVWQIPVAMQTGGGRGMRLMDDSLLDLVRRKKIPLEEALTRATDKTKFLKPQR